MRYKAEKILTKILEEFPLECGNHQMKKWFLQQFHYCCNEGGNNDENCTLEDFAVLFLNEIKRHMEIHLKVNEMEKKENVQLNDSAFESAVKRIFVSDKIETSEATNKIENVGTVEKVVQPTRSNNKDRKSPTPLKYQQNPLSDKGQLQSNTSPLLRKRVISPICLGDFIVNAQRTHSSTGRHQKPRTPQSQTKSKGMDSNVAESTHLKSHTEKSKKRVAPTKIKSSVSRKLLDATDNASIFSGESSFSNENNFLQLADVSEIEDKRQCAILEARNILKTNPRVITEAVSNISNHHNTNRRSKDKTICINNDQQDTINANATKFIGNQDNATKINLLNKLAKIYSVLIDLNITVNVLNELSCIINICNANSVTTSEQTKNGDKLDLNQSVKDLSINQMNSNDPLSMIFSDLLNKIDAIYFVSRLLSLQRRTIASLDTESLNVILNSNCYGYMENDVKSYLMGILHYKLQLPIQKQIFGDYFMEQQQNTNEKQTFSNVYFQEDDNSRYQFTNQQEFVTYRVQRDSFYKCFNLWEANYLNPQWNYTLSITPIIKDIFHLSENVVNMMHFAKLFVSQLLISAIHLTPTPEEIGLADMKTTDQAKLEKLSQRLIAPSKFSIDYEFPRMQSFFQQFIAEARSIPFLVQLKMELYDQLLMRNNCSLNYINIYQKFTFSRHDYDHGNGNINYIDNDDRSPSLCHNFLYHNDNDNNNHDYYIMKRDEMESLLLLAKFLGYVTSLPYSNVNISRDGNNINNNDINIPVEIEERQIHLRNAIQGKFETSTVLLEAMKHGKLLITLPWMVQYYAMLDSVALQLEHHLETLHIMFGLYAQLGFNNDHCDFNNHQVYAEMVESNNNELENNATAFFIIRICLGWLIEVKHILNEKYYEYRSFMSAKSSCECKVNENTNGDMTEIIKRALSIYKVPKNIDILHNMDPLLEMLLTTICPFLAEFRVSIIPTWITFNKSASRSGKCRYITPRITELQLTPKRQQSPLKFAQVSDQTRLLQAFQDSLSSNARLLINFCTDRCYQSTIKDGHTNILLPSKQMTDMMVYEICSTDFSSVSRKLNEIFTKAKVDAIEQWDAIIPQMLEKRIIKVLEGLLPEEASQGVLMKTYFYIIQQEAQRKINDWLHVNMFRENFYCSNLTNLALNICKGNMKNYRKPSTNPNVYSNGLTNQKRSLSTLLEDLQYWLHFTSIRKDQFNDLNAIRALLECIIEALQYSSLLSLFLYQALTINIIQLIKNIICSNKVQLTNDVIQSTCDIWSNPDVQHALASNGINICDTLLTIPFIEGVTKVRKGYDQLEQLLIIMVNRKIIFDIDIQQTFDVMLKNTWSPHVTQKLSKMLSNVNISYKDTS